MHNDPPEARTAKPSPRGLAAALGLTVPLGMGKLMELKQLVDADKTVPEAARQAVTELLDQGRWLAESIETFEAEILAHARRDDVARRLATIPGIGPITVSLIAATAQTSGFATVADIGVSFCETSKPTNRVIEPPSMVRTAGRHSPDRSIMEDLCPRRDYPMSTDGSTPGR